MNHLVIKLELCVHMQTVDGQGSWVEQSVSHVFPAYTIYLCQSQHPIEDDRNMLSITVTIGSGRRGGGGQVHYKGILRKSNLENLFFFPNCFIGMLSSRSEISEFT